MARRSGLGKGLGALIPTEVTSQAGGPLQEVPIASIRPNTRQPRTYFDEEAMASLAASISEVGLLQPVLVRPLEDDAAEVRYELVAGERRWRAARRAGLQTIPVLVRESVGDVNSLEQALVENLQRENLGPLEEAAAYLQLIDDFSLTHEQVAKRVGKSRAAITNTLRLLQLPARVQRALSEGSISAGHGRALLGTPDRALQETLVGRIVAEGWSVRQVEEAVRGGAAGGAGEAAGTHAGAPAGDGAQGSGLGTAAGMTGGSTEVGQRPPLPEPGVLELEELLSAYLNTRVKVELHHRRGRVVVEFATLDDLERIYRAVVEGPHTPGGAAHAAR